MATFSSGSNDAFQSGISHLTNSGRANENSLTLNGAASGADQGLDQTSARWNAEAGTGYEPHSILAGLPGMSGNGMSAADAQRLLPGGQQLRSPNGSGEDAYGESTLLNRMYGDND